MPDTIAAVDLGSNSFHMVVAREAAGGTPHVLDRIREMVRLGAGLDERGNLTPAATETALACLARFGQRVRHLPPGSVRAVGTNTLRRARNGQAFLEEANRALGHPIEIISGVEEARLIYRGVAHSLAAGEQGRRVVMDIGGGSTEFIIGDGFEPLHMESTYMGCVSFSQRFFPTGRISAKAMRKAELAALIELEPHQSTFLALGWDEAVGASGTIKAIARVIEEAGWSDEGITLPALEKLGKSLIEAGDVEALVLPGLSERRRPIFPGGVAILTAAFRALELKRMRVSDGALREGVLFDLVGRLCDADVRDRGVAVAAERYRVDSAQAARVAETALALFDQRAAEWGLDPAVHRPLLGWAARLHEVGLSIAHSQHQKHGAYILANADLIGFSRQEQSVLAALVRAQRRKFPLKELKRQPGSTTRLVRLAILLRLAVTLRRSRNPAPLPPLVLEDGGNKLLLTFPPGWLDDHPLTRADLEQERAFLAAADIELRFR